MKGTRGNNRCAIALGVLALWAAGPVHAQEEPNTGTAADTRAAAAADTGAATGADLHPPNFVDSTPPLFPTEPQHKGLHPTVILLVTMLLLTTEWKVSAVWKRFATRFLRCCRHRFGVDEKREPTEAPFLCLWYVHYQ